MDNTRKQQILVAANAEVKQPKRQEASHSTSVTVDDVIKQITDDPSVDVSDECDFDSLNVGLDADALVAKELNQMSTEQRDRIFYEVHGVADPINESPDFIKQKLKEFNQELAKITTKVAYNLAKSQSTSYVEDSNFQLKFLRAEEYDVCKAAQRIVSFFEGKRSIFGDHCLARDITLNDLNEDDLKCVESGYFQLLSCRDQGGRPVVVVIPSLRHIRTRDNVLKAFWYSLMAVSEDEENQLSGVVTVVYNIGPNRVFDPIQVKKVGDIRQQIPVRSACVHICYEDTMLHIITSIAMLSFGEQSRLRFRNHHGSHMECMVAIQSFGIPRTIIPITDDGEFLLDDHKAWCEKRKELELERNVQTKSSDTPPQLLFDAPKHIALPGYFDVLFGRGKNIAKHPGNLRFHLLLNMYEARYETSSKSEKGAVVEEIIAVVQRSSGRFLKKDKQRKWVEVDIPTARDKVSQTYRTRRAKNNMINGKLDGERVVSTKLRRLDETKNEQAM